MCCLLQFNSLFNYVFFLQHGDKWENPINLFPVGNTCQKRKSKRVLLTFDPWLKGVMGKSSTWNNSWTPIITQHNLPPKKVFLEFLQSFSSFPQTSWNGSGYRRGLPPLPETSPSWNTTGIHDVIPSHCVSLSIYIYVCVCVCVCVRVRVCVRVCVRARVSVCRWQKKQN